MRHFTQDKDKDVDRARIQSHYDRKPEHSRQDRRRFLKNNKNTLSTKHNACFHNWVKSVLIQTCVAARDKPAIVLDMAGGKGGDLIKWQHAHIQRLVLADVSRTSVQQAAARYTQMRCPFRATFMLADCFHPHFLTKLQALPYRFDAVSCQFALHYAFESKARIQQTLCTLAKSLKKGGVFFGTVPNGTRILKQLTWSPTHRHWCVGNAFYHLNFGGNDAKTPPQAPAFGCRYTFYLKDAIDHAPEYLVQPHILKALCKEVGLELIFMDSFDTIKIKYYKQYRQLFKRMHCLDPLPQPLAPISALYMAFAFKKIK